MDMTEYIYAINLGEAIHWAMPVAGYDKDFLGPNEHLNDNCLF